MLFADIRGSTTIAEGMTPLAFRSLLDRFYTVATRVVFDEDGQLLNASLADYLLPTALEVPHMEIAHTVTESPLNPLGIKGAGEAGAIPVGPLFAQAIEDALGLLEQKVELNEIPLSPGRLFELTAKLR